MNAQKHVIVLYRREGESYWLHTRGMAEFGRPDIGISDVPEEKVDAYKLISFINTLDLTGTKVGSDGLT